MKILVVDDASFVRSRAVRILQREQHHEVVEATTGRQALQNGADYFLTKPYEEEHLLHALQNAFKKQD